MKQFSVISVVLGLSLSPAFAADDFMSGEELSALLNGGKTIKLGGKGEGYSGTLDIKADGTAQGSAKTAGGRTISIAGTWYIKNNEFCRKWVDLDNGEEVCEAWKKVSTNKVEVQVNMAKIGVNYW